MLQYKLQVEQEDVRLSTDHAFFFFFWLDEFRISVVAGFVVVVLFFLVLFCFCSCPWSSC